MIRLGEAGTGAQLRELSITEALVVLRLLTDRREELSRSRAQGPNRLCRLMTDLVPRAESG